MSILEGLSGLRKALSTFETVAVTDYAAGGAVTFYACAKGGCALVVCALLLAAPGWSGVTMRLRGRKFLAALLIASQLNLLAARPALAGPTEKAATASWFVENGHSLVEKGRGLLDFVMSPIQDVFGVSVGEGGLRFTLVWLAAYSLGTFAGSVLKSPAVLRDWKALKAQIEEARKNYERRRTEFVEYPKQIESIERALEKHRSDLVAAENGRQFRQADILRYRIATLEAHVDQLRAKAPFIVMAEAIRNVQLADESLGDHIQKLRGVMADLIRNGEPLQYQDTWKTGVKAIERWKQNPSPEHIGDWLESDAAQAFLHTEQGKVWLREYLARVDHLGKQVDGLGKVYNSLVDEHNALVTEEEAKPRLDFQRSRHGVRGDRFMLVHEDATRSPHPVRLNRVIRRFDRLCGSLLASLQKKTKALEDKNNYRTQFADQRFHAKVLAGSTIPLLGYYAWFRATHNKSFTEAQADTKTEEKLVELERTGLGAQIRLENAKGEQSSLAPFNQAVLKAFLGHQGNIEKIIAASFDSRDMYDGKQEKLNERIKANTKDILQQNLENALWQVAENKNIKTIGPLVDFLYTKDEVARKTMLSQLLVLMYREMVDNLYSTIVDEQALNQIEKEIIPKLVEETVARLAEQKDKAIVQPALPAVVPLPGVKSDVPDKTTTSEPKKSDTSAQTSLPALAPMTSPSSASVSLPVEPVLAVSPASGLMN